MALLPLSFPKWKYSMWMLSLAWRMSWESSYDLDVVAGSYGRVSSAAHHFSQRTEILPYKGLRVMTEKYPVEVLIRFLFEDVLVLLVPPVEDPVVSVIDTEHEVQQDSEEGNGRYRRG